MSKARLFEVEAKERWRGSRALVPVPRDVCPRCHVGSPQEQTITELALFIHGGYGAARRSVWLHCACGWELRTAVSEVNPRHVA